MGRQVEKSTLVINISPGHGTKLQHLETQDNYNTQCWKSELNKLIVIAIIDLYYCL
jgi:hypothetical protein